MLVNGDKLIMNVDELKQAKAELEKDILVEVSNHLDNFHKKTGHYPESLDLYIHPVTGLGGTTYNPLLEVKAYISI